MPSIPPENGGTARGDHSGDVTPNQTDEELLALGRVMGELAALPWPDRAQYLQTSLAELERSDRAQVHRRLWSLLQEVVNTDPVAVTPMPHKPRFARANPTEYDVGGTHISYKSG
jgi:hypothetical protein